MEYCIRGSDSDGSYSISITEKELVKAQKCKKRLLKALGIEEKFNIVLENYLEYEKELLDVTLRKAISFDMSDSRDIIHSMNRRLVNLLSTCRMYLDQVPQDIGSLLGQDSVVRESFQDQRSEEYDSRLGYRVMEALRNYVQHRGLPVHLISYKSSWIDPESDEDSRHRRQRTIIKINVDRLEEDKEFKKSVVEESRSIGSQVNLKPLVREYITGLMEAHQVIRKELEQHLNKWDKAVLDLVERFRTETETNAGLLESIAIGPDGRVLEEVQLLEDIISRRRTLRGKNRGFGDLLKLRISSF